MRALALLAILLAAGCATPATTPTPPTVTTPGATEPHARYGVAFTPAGNDVAGFFAEAPQLGSVVLWGGPADQLAQADAAPAVVAQLAAQKGLRVAVQTNANASTLDGVVAFAKRYHPAYVALAVEADRLDATAFDALAAWYPGAYRAVKDASPSTLVFVTWQFEHLESAGWDRVARFAPVDLLAFTTYPAISLPDASALPPSYYANATAHAAAAGERVGFTEVGDAADAPSSPAQQAAFVEAFFRAANATDPALVVWFEVHDQPGVSPPMFRHMGLVAEDGSKRAAWDAWRAHAGAAS